MEDLCDQLSAKGLGARRFELTAFRADGGASTVRAGAARAVRTAGDVGRLFRDRLEGIDPGFGIDLMVLEAFGAQSLETRGASLGASLRGERSDPEALAALADRIAARLGDETVRIRIAHESRLPERAETLRPYDGRTEAVAAPAPVGPRPLTLLDPPEQVQVLALAPDGPPMRFIWRRAARRIVRSDGPERIAPEWWRAYGTKPRARDYYRVEDEAGRRYWIYREGLYGDDRGDPPAWFIHGLFA